jgi:catechol 2,3-dioxygenase-like lactoylglutathione lyase family enzyme
MRLGLVCLLVLLSPAKAQEAPYQDPGIRRFVQIAIVCRNVEASSKRWAALLGVPAPRIAVTRAGKEVQEMFRGRPSEGQIKIAYFNLPNVALELMEPVGGDTSWKEHLDKHGEGVHHVAFRVEDLDRSLEQCERLGYPVLHRGRFDRLDGTYVYLDSQEALGVTVELLHYDQKK